MSLYVMTTSRANASILGCLEGSVKRIEATAAIAALEKFDVGPAMPAFSRLALTIVAVKSLLPNFPHSPLAIRDGDETCYRVYPHDISSLYELGNVACFKAITQRQVGKRCTLRKYGVGGIKKYGLWRHTA